jgi:SAM-dependent methyltransferase
MTVFNDHFSARADVYRQYRPDYPPELFDWLAARVNPRERAWDVATGNGQAAVRLASVFDEVIATDASERQIAHAVPHDRVRYRVAAAEASGLPDASVDCVTVAAAIHWFDVPKFYEEVRRVTRPYALLAVWSYDRVHVFGGNRQSHVETLPGHYRSLLAERAGTCRGSLRNDPFSFRGNFRTRIRYPPVDRRRYVSGISADVVERPSLCRSKRARPGA